MYIFLYCTCILPEEVIWFIKTILPPQVIYIIDINDVILLTFVYSYVYMKI